MYGACSRRSRDDGVARARAKARGEPVAAEGRSSIDALSQFKLAPVFGHFGETLHFSNANVMMLAASVLTLLLMWVGMSPRAMIPGRLQSAAEMAYETVMNLCIEQIGHEGKKFFPFVFTLFMFVLTLNMISLIPHTFSVTSQIIITAALALTVFFTVLTYGFIKNGFRFFNVFVPKGVPLYILPLIVFIELMSFLTRPLSHSVRLFANMLAGHITLQVFAGFVVLLGTAFGAIGWIGGALPLLMVILLYALETLVAFLQAYVFAILTCIYLNDAIHPGH